jgi:hypothetical protein
MTGPPVSSHHIQTEGFSMSKGLKSGGVSLLSGTSISVNGCSPAYSLAITLGLIAPFAGAKAPAVVLIAFPLMFMITVPYMLLTRYYPDCGASFSWVTRAMSAYAGSVFVGCPRHWYQQKSQCLCLMAS